MDASYIALIHPPEGKSGYGVTFPDLPGCVSAGTTHEEALALAAEALAGHIAAMRADDDTIPKARNFAELQNDQEFLEDVASGAEPTRIATIVAPAPKERINISIGKDVLREIDKAALRQGMNRSAFIEAVALKASRAA